MSDADDVLLDAVRGAVGGVNDPELHRTLADLGMIGEVERHDGVIHVGVTLTIAGCPASQRIEREVREAALTAAPHEPVMVDFSVMTPAQRAALVERVRGGARRIPFDASSLTRVIAVTSGKGGVGKSTVTANLAVALAERGLAVGLVDADVHGFSQPGLLGATGAPTRVGELILPLEAHGVRVISIGMFLREGEDVVAWRGPMLHRTIEQFLTDVHFGDLDILLLDLPPGTGDIAISVGQLLPHAEVLVVTTPQDAAAEVAVRSGRVARQTGQRVIGVVENMAALHLPDGSVVDLFGSGGGQRVADALGDGVELWGSIPLSTAVRTGGDDGTPVVLAAPEDPASTVLRSIAARLAIRPSSLSGKPLPLRTTS